MYNRVTGKLNPIATLISGALGYHCTNIYNTPAMASYQEM